MSGDQVQGNQHQDTGVDAEPWQTETHNNLVFIVRRGEPVIDDVPERYGLGLYGAQPRIREWQRKVSESWARFVLHGD